MTSPTDDRPRLVPITSLLVLGVGLTALFLGKSWFWMVFVVGYAVVVPLVAVLTGADEDDVEAALDVDAGATERSESTHVETSKRDGLETLRDRYARGELSEAEFERKVETLLETETLEDARRRVDYESDADPAERTRERDID